jgi:hypothetical protein
MASETKDKSAEPFQTQYTLSPMVVTPAAVGLLMRELEDLENSLLQLKVREAGKHIALPAISRSMKELTDHNKLNLLHPGDRHALKGFLEEVKASAPQMHISFSTEPTEVFLAELTAWLRREINPRVLFSIGLQPAIGAGCMLRTTNKYFDMSLRQTFVSKRQLLLEQIVPAAPAPAPAPDPAPPAPAAVEAPHP